MKVRGEMGKKALSVFMTAVMVAQMYTSPIQTAYAQGTETAAKQQVAQALEQSLNNDVDAQSEDSESKSVVDDATTPAQENEGESTEPAADGTTGGGAPTPLTSRPPRARTRARRAPSPATPPTLSPTTPSCPSPPTAPPRVPAASTTIPTRRAPRPCR